MLRCGSAVETFGGVVCGGCGCRDGIMERLVSEKNFDILSVKEDAVLSAVFVL